MSSGHPAEPVLASDRAVRNLRWMEEIISEHVEDIVATAQSINIHPPDSLQFRFRDIDGNFCVEEVNCGFILKFSSDGILKMYSRI